MRIDIQNYEAFFLDYKEGNLNDEQVKELFTFLEEYPQLKAEFDSYEPVMLELDEVLMDKSLLKKQEVDDEMLVAYVENELGDEEKAKVDLLAAQNTSLAKNLRFYRNTVITADEKIKFPHKHRLKKRGVVIFLQSNPAYMRVAAALLLLLGLFFLLSRWNAKPHNVARLLAIEKGDNKVAGPNEKKESVAPKKANMNLAAIDQERKEAGYEKKKNKTKRKVSSEHLNERIPVATNTPTVNASSVLTNNNEKREDDSLAIAQVLPESKTTYRSYFNYSAEDDENENIPADAKTGATASAGTGKKTFFQKITNAARKVNALGMKKVDGEEQRGINSISIGSFVLSETVSN